MKYRAILFFLLIPFVALAHGEEVLLTLAILPLSVLGFLLFMVTFGKRVTDRLILICVYVVSLMLTFSFTGYLPYLNNKALINYSLIGIPVVITLVTHLLLVKGRRQ